MIGCCHQSWPFSIIKLLVFFFLIVDSDEHILDASLYEIDRKVEMVCFHSCFWNPLKYL